MGTMRELRHVGLGEATANSLTSQEDIQQFALVCGAADLRSVQHTGIFVDSENNVYGINSLVLGSTISLSSKDDAAPLNIEASSQAPLNASEGDVYIAKGLQGPAWRIFQDNRWIDLNQPKDLTDDIYSIAKEVARSEIGQLPEPLVLDQGLSREDHVEFKSITVESLHIRDELVCDVSHSIVSLDNVATIQDQPVVFNAPLTVNAPSIIDQSVARHSSPTFHTVTAAEFKINTMSYINSREVHIGDNIIVLNAEEMQNPTVNAGIEIERGSEENEQLLWIEKRKTWQMSNMTVDTEVQFKDVESDGYGKLICRNNKMFFVAPDGQEKEIAFV